MTVFKFSFNSIFYANSNRFAYEFDGRGRWNCYDITTLEAEDSGSLDRDYFFQNIKPIMAKYNNEEADDEDIYIISEYLRSLELAAA